MLTSRIAISGFGAVGRATAHLLLARRDRYRTVFGVDVRLVAVCGSRSGAFDPAGLAPDRFDILEAGLSGPDFIASSGADVLIEAGPSDFRTCGPGIDYIRSALTGGVDTIVISKGALVCDGRALRDRARVSGAMLKISGATAAALPTIDLLHYNLAGCTTLRVDGILNATSNYLLDAMMIRGVGLDEALAEAQAGGFAEPDPRNDIEGWDTACKLLILANFGLGADLMMTDLTVEGIQSVTSGHIAQWRADGLAPRLVGSVIRDGDALRASVGIRTYPPNDPFAHIAGKNKAIRIETDAMGEIVAIGGGSGPIATAAAALKDLEHIFQSRSLR